MEVISLAIDVLVLGLVAMLSWQGRAPKVEMLETPSQSAQIDTPNDYRVLGPYQGAEDFEFYTGTCERTAKSIRTNLRQQGIDAVLEKNGEIRG